VKPTRRRLRRQRRCTLGAATAAGGEDPARAPKTCRHLRRRGRRHLGEALAAGRGDRAGMAATCWRRGWRRRRLLGAAVAGGEGASSGHSDDSVAFSAATMPPSRRGGGGCGGGVSARCDDPLASAVAMPSFAEVAPQTARRAGVEKAEVFEQKFVSALNARHSPWRVSSRTTRALLAGAATTAAALREKFPGYPTTLNGPDLTPTEEILTSADSKSIRRIPVVGASAMSRDPTKKLDQVALWLAHNASHNTVSPHLIGPRCPLTLLLIVVDFLE